MSSIEEFEVQLDLLFRIPEARSGSSRPDDAVVRRLLEIQIWCAITDQKVPSTVDEILDPKFQSVPSILGSIDGAIEAINTALPRWWWRAGFCSLSSDASVGPDRDGPDSDVNDEDTWNGGFDNDVRNSDPPESLVPFALTGVMLKAKVALLKARSKDTVRQGWPLPPNFREDEMTSIEQYRAILEKLLEGSKNDHGWRNLEIEIWCAITNKKSPILR